MKKKADMTRRSQELRSNATKEEKTLWYQYLRKYPIQFRRQVVFGKYIADFYCAKAQLVIELDGSQHYDTEGIEKDRIRTKYLESIGLQVLRFSNADVNRNLSGVCQVIDRVVKIRCSEKASAESARCKSWRD